MPAASAEKRARQRANKLLRTESEAAVTGAAPSDAPPPAQTIEITESLSIPAPTSFTISYTPVAISYPEPVNSTAQLPTDAIRVTRDQLADMLHQSYVHGSEHGWKTHFAAANEHLQASYKQDMRDAATAFAENEKAIREESFDRGYNYGTDDCEAQLASLQDSLTAKYDMRHIETLLDLDRRCQESHEAGIREERERWETARAPQADVTTQTDPATTSSISVQTIPIIIPSPSSATISTQTEHLSPIISLTPFNWADDSDTIPIATIPIITPKQPRDFSSLRSSFKNPFSSLRRRHYYPKRQQTVPSCRYTQSYPVHLPTHHTPPIPNNHLDWRRDPRLFELSRVLRTLGWFPP